ncbi:MAG TPA: hypothetical protein VMW74_09955 [Nitrosopumilaceae archaeon]|nr:hypothetical protein [Nitrosopumilaceae archaeon]
MENEELKEDKKSVESKDSVESKSIVALKYSIDNDGVVSCNVSKEKKDIQNKDIKPKKRLFLR